MNTRYSRAETVPKRIKRYGGKAYVKYDGQKYRKAYTR